MHLSQINIYPVKSLKGIPLQESKVEARGLAHDRRWMIVDTNNKCVTQREFPVMATITTGITADGLVLGAPGAGSINVGFGPAQRKEETVTIWDDMPQALIYDDATNGWLSRAIGTNCRLVYMPDDFVRPVEENPAVKDDIVSFADAYPFLVISEGSLDDLNTKLPEPLPMNRFRPNIVVTGAEAFAEHDWKKFTVGESVFAGVKPCKRCVMTTIDQQRGEFDGKEPLKTLAGYRAVPGGVIFGENLLIENPGGVIRIGDKVEVLERKEV